MYSGKVLSLYCMHVHSIHSWHSCVFDYRPQRDPKTAEGRRLVLFSLLHTCIHLYQVLTMSFDQKLQTLRMHLREKYRLEQEQDDCNIVKRRISFRMPDSSKVEHSFKATETTQVRCDHALQPWNSYETCTINSLLQALYAFVFSSRDIDKPFSISQCYPRVFVPCSTEQPVGEAQLLVVEDHESEGLVDPLLLLEEAAEVCVYHMFDALLVYEHCILYRNLKRRRKPVTLMSSSKVCLLSPSSQYHVTYWP